MVPPGFIGTTLWPFIHIKYTRKEYVNTFGEFKLGRTITHESIHLKQQVSLLVILFYVWYLLEWFIKLFKYGKHSYMNISFEREAYANSENVFYPRDRKFWGHLKYL